MTGLTLKLLSLVLVAMTLTPVTSFASASAAPPTTGITIEGNVIYIIQGETNLLNGSEPVDHFYELHILSYSLPWNESRIHTSIPTNARNISVFYGYHALNSLSYGRETTGPFSGSFFIDVPASHDRTLTISNISDSAQDFEAPGSEFVNTTYNSGSLHLLPNQTNGLYTSPEIVVQGAQTTVSANLSLTGTGLENVTAWVSNDNGTSWTSSPTNSSGVDFPINGTSLRVRLELRGNTSSGWDPKVTKLNVTAKSLLLSSVFPIHISYRWTASFSDRKAYLNLTEPLPYAPDASAVAMIYLAKGYTASGIGVDLGFDRNGTMSAYKDKDLYLNMSIHTGYAQMGVEIVAPPPSSQWVLYLGIVVGIALIGCVAYLGRRRLVTADRAEPSADEDVGEERRKPVRTPTDQDIARKKELVTRKKAILSEMESLREDASSGKSDRASSETRLADLKKEFKQVRNEINRLERKSSAAASASSETEAASVQTDSYGATLAALARIDDDFERGRLPKGTHESLRRQYMDKATALKAEQELLDHGAPSPMEIEKVKLMEAIVALDEEHDGGEVDDKVYNDLRASYKAELAEIIRKIEQSGDGAD